MTERAFRVGDPVAWAEVPDGALVFDRGDEDWPEPAHALRLAGRGRWVHEAHVTDWTLELEDWPWQAGEERGQGTKGVTLVALGLTGQETAAELQRLAEVFAVRADLLAALHRADKGGQGSRDGALACVVAAAYARADESEEAAASALAARLHAAGWQPGDSAERAGEILEESPDGR